MNRYKYQDGYLHKRERGDDDPAPSRQDWRKRLVVTLFAELEQTEPAAKPSRRRRA